MEDAAERAGLATEPYLKAPTALADHELPVLLLLETAAQNPLAIL
jgi:hypothetical protein